MAAIEKHQKTCPVCAAVCVHTSTAQRFVSLSPGPFVPYQATVDKCPVCGEEGDFDAVNDAVIMAARQHAETLAIQVMMDDLAERGIPAPALECALSLPQGTVRRWCDGQHHDGAAALLRIVWQHPAVLDDHHAWFYEPTTRNARDEQNR